MEYSFTAPQKRAKELWQEKTVHVLSGGFNIVGFENFAALGYLPKGIALSVNHAARTATPIKGAQVFEAVAADGTAVKVKKTTPGLLFIAGDPIGTAAASTTVASVDKSNAAYDVINLTAAVGALSVGTNLFTVLAGGGAGKTLKTTGLCYADVKYKAGKQNCDVVIQAYEVMNAYLPYPLTDTQKTELTGRFYVV